MGWSGYARRVRVDAAAARAIAGEPMLPPRQVLDAIVAGTVTLAFRAS